MHLAVLVAAAAAAVAPFHSHSHAHVHGGQQEQPVYKNASASIPARVEDLLGRMTTEEKV